MRHIEASKKIVTGAPVDFSAVKYSFVQRMRSAFHVETVGEGAESFTLTASSKPSTYAFALNVSIKCDQNRIRILTDGQNQIRMATKAFYVMSLLLVLILSLFSETIGSQHCGGITMNAMFFLVIGGFIIYDHGKKMDEPQAILENVLDSLEAEFG
jgi:hypothetical protein